MYVKRISRYLCKFSLFTELVEESFLGEIGESFARSFKHKYTMVWWLELAHDQQKE